MTQKAHPILILLRHGQSIWNQRNLFTGWVDVPLSEKGIQEAFEAGKKIQDIPIDIVFTSTLSRAIMTAMLALTHHKSHKVPVLLHEGKGKEAAWSKIYSAETEAHILPVHSAWELNERMYGELQGLNKAETAEKFGADQVKIWRRSFNVAPPGGESLEMTAARSIPYFQKHILSELKKGKNVFVSAHGNSLRSIMMHIDGLTKEQVLELELETGAPVIYSYNSDVFHKGPHK